VQSLSEQYVILQVWQSYLVHALRYATILTLLLFFFPSSRILLPTVFSSLIFEHEDGAKTPDDDNGDKNRPLGDEVTTTTMPALP
jgi:hypothetical protein